VFCTMTYDGTSLSALAFLNPGAFPEFEGEEAWFRVRWFSKRKREFLSQIDRPPHRPLPPVSDRAAPDRPSVDP